MMDFHIQADNPRGLAYDELHHTADKAQQIVKRIAFQGGTNITVNGYAVPMELIAAMGVE